MIDFIWTSSDFPFSLPGSNPRSHIAFSHCVSSLFQSMTVSYPFLVLMILKLFRSTDACEEHSSFKECLLVWICLRFFLLIMLRLCICSGNLRVMFLPVCHIRGYVISMCEVVSELLTHMPM